MTTSHDTCFSILLDHEDINGFIDIAHYGIEAMVKHSACRALIQSFAEIVVKQATEHDIQFDAQFDAQPSSDPQQDPVASTASSVSTASKSSPVLPQALQIPDESEDSEETEAIEGQAVITIQRLLGLEQAHKRRK